MFNERMRNESDVIMILLCLLMKTDFNDVFLFLLKDQLDYHHLFLLVLQYKYDLIDYKSHHDQQNGHV